MSTLENAVRRMTRVSGSDFLHLPQHGQTVRVGQAVIEQHEVDPFAVLLDRFGGGLRLDHAIAFLRQPVVQRPADELLVVYDENRRFRHLILSL